MKYFKAFLFSLLLIYDVSSWAQVKISAEIRPRAEFRNGFKRPLNLEEQAAFFIEQRSRFYVEFHNDKIDFMLVPQDVRIWGNAEQANKTDKALFNMQQAWAAYRFNLSSRIMTGRMELEYDNARILGNLDWAQQGRSHDLLKYEYNDRTVRLHAGLAFNQDDTSPEPTKLSNTYYTRLNNYKTMQFVWFNKTMNENQFSLLVLNEGRQYSQDTVYYLQTIGSYGVINCSSFSLTGEYYFQTGRNKLGATTRAHLGSLSLTYRLNNEININAGGDYLTGDDPKTNKNEAFDPLYGTHHKFYGFMDYFYVGNAHGNAGLGDLYLKCGWQKGPFATQLDGHRFTTSANVLAETGNSLDRYLGTELDFSLGYNVDPFFNIKGGYSMLFYTPTMRSVKQINTGNQASWAWLMLTFKPVLFQN